jgi:hypothetical protein
VSFRDRTIHMCVIQRQNYTYVCHSETELYICVSFRDSTIHMCVIQRQNYTYVCHSLLRDILILILFKNWTLHKYITTERKVINSYKNALLTKMTKKI